MSRSETSLPVLGVAPAMETGNHDNSTLLDLKEDSVRKAPHAGVRDRRREIAMDFL